MDREVFDRYGEEGLGAAPVAVAAVLTVRISATQSMESLMSCSLTSSVAETPSTPLQDSGTGRKVWTSKIRSLVSLWAWMALPT